MALIVTVLATGLLLGLGAALVLTTTVETGISANYREGLETLYAADAGIERVLLDLAAAPDWDAVLSGAARSTFVDGPAGGTRQIAGGATIDLTVETNQLRCGATAACSTAAMDAIAAERPWGRNNPRWQLYGSGQLVDASPGRIDSVTYIAVWVADDPSENDADPLRDGQPPFAVDPRNPGNPGRGLLALRGHAYGPAGARRAVQATVARVGPAGPAPSSLRILAWREVR